MNVVQTLLSSTRSTTVRLCLPVSLLYFLSFHLSVSLHRSWLPAIDRYLVHWRVVMLDIGLFQLVARKGAYFDFNFIPVAVTNVCVTILNFVGKARKIWRATLCWWCSILARARSPSPNGNVRVDSMAVWSTRECGCLVKAHARIHTDCPVPASPLRE